MIAGMEGVAIIHAIGLAGAVVMAKVLGVGGVFFKSADPAALRVWYNRALGIEMEQWGAFFTPDLAAGQPGAGTAFAPFSADTDHFAPSDNEYMFNLMVDDLDAMLARCLEAGVTPLKVVDEGMGRFAHIMDPEGRKIELWEPKPYG